MSDILYDAALDFTRLKNIAYEIHLDKKQTLYRLFLHFPSESFFHLAGLQHLRDISFSSTNKERIFKDILSRKITTATIEKSVFYEKYYLEERIQNLHFLERILDGNSVTYLINNHCYRKYTDIDADYLFEHKENLTDISYLFVKKILSSLENECRACSFFKKHKRDYTKGTSKPTILQIAKITNYKNEDAIVEILYENAAYKK